MPFPLAAETTPWWQTALAQVGIFCAALIAGAVALRTAKENRAQDRTERENDREHDRKQREAASKEDRRKRRDDDERERRNRSEDRAHARRLQLDERRADVAQDFATGALQARMHLDRYQADNRWNTFIWDDWPITDEMRDNALLETQRRIDEVHARTAAVLVAFGPESPVRLSATAVVGTLAKARHAAYVALNFNREYLEAKGDDRSHEQDAMLAKNAELDAALADADAAIFYFGRHAHLTLSMSTDPRGGA
jgi:hypothetical protein